MDEEGSYSCSCDGNSYSGNGYVVSNAPWGTPPFFDADFVASGCTDINDCAGTPCQHGGLCTDTGASSFECECPSGEVAGGDGGVWALWVGHTCTTDVDECQSESQNNCLHDCINTRGSFSCQCRSGYYGNARDPATSPADWGVAGAANLPFTGCTDVDDCVRAEFTSYDSCLNGGTCQDRPDGSGEVRRGSVPF